MLHEPLCSRFFCLQRDLYRQCEYLSINPEILFPSILVLAFLVSAWTIFSLFLLTAALHGGGLKVGWAFFLLSQLMLWSWESKVAARCLDRRRLTSRSQIQSNRGGASFTDASRCSSSFNCVACLHPRKASIRVSSAGFCSMGGACIDMDFQVSFMV